MVKAVAIPDNSMEIFIYKLESLAPLLCVDFTSLIAGRATTASQAKKKRMVTVIAAHFTKRILRIANKIRVDKNTIGDWIASLRFAGRSLLLSSI